MMTPPTDMYEQMLAHQGGVCAICLRPPKNRRLDTDHDHKTGLIRGLLCWRCNRGLLGSSSDDPARLRRAAEYLENPPAIEAIGEIMMPKRKPKRRKK